MSGVSSVRVEGSGRLAAAECRLSFPTLGLRMKLQLEIPRNEASIPDPKLDP